MTKSSKYLYSIFIFVMLIFISCSEEGGDEFGIFSSEDGITVEMEGEITSSTPDDWKDLIDVYPNVEMMIMGNCPGSSDDEANLRVSRAIKSQGIHIHLEEDAEIASGAVDMFFAGNMRTRDEGSKIGVHSWADGDGNEATDFSLGDEVHRQYIDYYREMGLSMKESSDFYFFTINAAPASEIHWMTEQEIEKYKLIK